MVRTQGARPEPVNHGQPTAYFCRKQAKSATLITGAVVLWSQTAATADVGLLDSLPETRPRSRTFVAGPGWEDLGVPARVQPLTSLAQAVDALVTATR